MRKKGFTLVELMIIIAIIALLASVALTSYRSYIKKAQAKELITIARACVQEIISECLATGEAPELNDLESCKSQNIQAKYLSSISFSGTPDCNSTFDIEVTGTVKAGGQYKVTCTGSTTGIDCTTPTSVEGEGGGG